jgi:hypothetical protein
MLTGIVVEPARWPLATKERGFPYCSTPVCGAVMWSRSAASMCGVAPTKTEKSERQIEVTDAFGTVGGFLFHQVEN